MPRTLHQKLWESHVVREDDDGALLYIDRHLVHEVTSPQAFEGLRLAGRKPWRTNSILAVPDHNVPTDPASRARIPDAISRAQVETLDANCAAHNLREFKMDDPRQGIVHIIGPEQGATLPGMTVVCGDSHTSTHGALGCLAFGIGTTEIEHVLAAQCLPAKRPREMKIQVDGKLRRGVGAKDVILAIIGKIGTAGGVGFAMEYAGEAIRDLDMAGRMTVCNMSIEAGARAGMIAVDDATLAFVESRPMAPRGKMWERAADYWRTLKSDDGAAFDRVVEMDAAKIKPQVSWGTSPEMVAAVDECVPHPESESDPVRRDGMARALEYMGLKSGTPLTEIPLDRIFIGSCTNARIEDLRRAAEIVAGKKKAKNIRQALVVPGSGLIRRQAEEEGLHRAFIDAGFEWREAGMLDVPGDERGQGSGG